MWDNPMNTTVPSITEVKYHCQETIQNSEADFVGLISGCDNPADVMTKTSDNRKMKRAIENGKCVTNPTREFILQVSKYRTVSYILISSVPMISDD